MGRDNDPAKSTPVTELPAGQTIQTLTGIENVPQPTTGIFEFVQWLIQGAPEVMDGGEPAMFGAQSSGADQGVYQTAKLKRDAALSIYAVPWAQICMGVAKAGEQAVACAAENRVATIRANIPGQGRVEVQLEKLRGEALCYPESRSTFPRPISEQEAQMAALLENANSVALYKAIADDPRNLAVIRKFPSLSGLEIPALDAVEQQEGEFELMLQSGPVDNPQVQAIQAQMAHGTERPRSADSRRPASHAAGTTGIAEYASAGIERSRSAGYQRESRCPRCRYVGLAHVSRGPETQVRRG